MKYRNIMSVDPGGTSGYAAIHIPSGPSKRSTHERVLSAKECGHLRCEEVKGGPTTQAIALMRLVEQLRCNTLLIESMYLDAPLTKRVKTMDILSPCKVGWGLAALVTHSLPHVRILWRPPSEMSVITDERLHRWELWIPGKKDARAALKHLLVYLRGTSVE